MNRTPWAGGLTSDRLPPARKQRPQQSSPGPGKPKTPDLPKSSEVLRLEGILNDLASGRSRSVQGCFCQARTHPLSVYTPICTSCGLILCTLHPVHLPCPSCSSSLLTPAQRNALIVQIQSELDETLAAEARERQRVTEAARTAAGAFPALPTAANSQNVGPHKVLSLNAKTGKAMLTSYRTPSPASAPRTPPTTDARDDRVPAPPNEVPYFKGARDSRNVWTDLTNADPVTYVDKPREKGKGKAEAKKGNKQG